ncbi:hypothetical protein M8998_07210 [Sphingobacterium sp. lm-10]|uniref:hypothetical protein n=1 Tax=Sphingobacterium sp. lm-10 TaxID=2944904 RepID=UPI002022088F|nr:hypothetical protein [Sphingobacterium sp. lm-10]MCL7987722.1 hypothetical protein [Sphingobacterium sp. lm-10]
MKQEEQGCKQQDQGKQKPSFMQVVNHPVTYALITIVSVFWYVLYYVTDRSDTHTKQMTEMQDKLYKQMIEEVRKQVTPAVDKVKEAAIKVDSAAVKVDSVAQQQKGAKK